MCVCVFVSKGKEREGKRKKEKEKKVVVMYRDRGPPPRMRRPMDDHRVQDRMFEEHDHRVREVFSQQR